jgi:hypothetical protein
MRSVMFQILEPQPLAAVRIWRWRILDEREKPVATSADLKSEEECHSAIEVVKATAADSGPTRIVPAPYP